MELIYSLIGSLVEAVGPIVTKVMLAMGISFTSFMGIGAIVDTIRSNFFSAMGGHDGVFLQLAGVLQLGTAFNMIASAIMVRLAFSGMNTGGTITKLLFGGSSNSGTP